MDNNERIAVALERIADLLDYFKDKVEEEMKEDEVKESERPESIAMDFDTYKKIRCDCAHKLRMYGKVSAGYVLSSVAEGYPHQVDFKWGWKDINDMKFTIKDDNVILDLTNVRPLI